MIDKVQYMYKMDMPAYKILVKKFNGEQPLMKYSVKTLQQRLKKQCLIRQEDPSVL